MDVKALVRHSHSKPSVADFSNVITTREYYWALFEFAQGSYPRTVTERAMNPPFTKNESTFRMSVVNTPTNIQGAPMDAPPIVVTSFFENLHYAAYFIQIHDVEARGMSRPIVFVLANQQEEIMDWMFYVYRAKIDQLVDAIQKSSRALFMKELKVYVKSLTALIEKECDAALESKLAELERLLPAFGMTKEECMKEEAVERGKDYFLQIHDDLRPIEEMIDLPNLKKVIEDFVGTLPKTQFNLHVSATALNTSVGYGVAPEDVINVLTAKFDNAKFTVCSIAQRDFFYSILYVLLSGNVLVLSSKDNYLEALSLAKRLSILSHNEVPFLIGQEPDGCDYMKYNIVVSQSSSFRNAAVLNLDEMKYTGPVCPHDVFIRKEVRCKVCANDTENSLLICISNDIKRLYARFKTKVGEMASRSLQTEDRMLKAMRYGKSDVPILKYWMACLFNKQKQKPILLDELHQSCE